VLVTAVLLCVLVLGYVPKGGPVWSDFARGPCLLHRKPFGVTSQVDVYVVRSYSILSSPRRRVVVWLERCCMKREKNSRKFSKDEKNFVLRAQIVDPLISSLPFSKLR
jgi:hypothetical protein